MHNRTGFIRGLILAMIFASTTACDSLFEVTNPGPIDDSALNSAAAMPGLVSGMSADLSVAVSQISIWSVLWGDELSHSGTLGAPTVFAGGVIPAFDVDPAWGDMHRARWVAEDGIERMKEVMGPDFEGALGARAYLLAGYANRLLGETVCHAVIDGGAPEDFRTHFQRADGQFSEALRIASAIGDSRLANAARGGRASVRAALGRWGEAVTDAEAVPANFRYDAIFSLNSAREGNGWRAATITRGEYTVHGTYWEGVSSDPRVPWKPVLTDGGTVANAANGRTPWLQQLKYESDADNIALTKGTEMLLIRAEAELRNGQVQEAMALINEARAVYNLGALSATTLDEAWPILHTERGAELWLEARRFWDLRRWYEETGPAHHPALDGKDRCVPIGRTEALTNPNV